MKIVGDRAWVVRVVLALGTTGLPTLVDVGRLFGLADMGSWVGYGYLLIVPGLVLWHAMRVAPPREPVRWAFVCVAGSLFLLMIASASWSTLGFNLQLARPFSIPFLAFGLGLAILVLAVASPREFRPKVDVTPEPRRVIIPTAASREARLLVVLALFLALLGIAAGPETFRAFGYRLNLPYAASILLLGAAIAWSLTRAQDASESMIAWVAATVPAGIIVLAAASSYYPFGWDVQLEAYLANRSEIYGGWDRAIPNLLGSALSITSVPAFAGALVGQGGEFWIWRVAPLIAALLPAGAYYLYRRVLPAPMALGGALFLAALPAFALELVQLSRQAIATVFVIVALTAVVDSKLDERRRVAVVLLSIAGIAFAHYSTAIVFLALLGGVVLAELVVRSLQANGTPSTQGGVASVGILTTGAIITAVWFAFGSGESGLFNSLIFSVREFVMPYLGGAQAARDAQVELAVSVGGLSPWRELTRVAYLAVLAFLYAGCLGYLARTRRTLGRWKSSYTVDRRVMRGFVESEARYLGAVVAAGGLLTLAIVVPGLGVKLNVGRFLFFAMLILAPLTVYWIAREGRPKRKWHSAYVVPGILLLASFPVMSLGLHYPAVGDRPSNPVLERDMDFPRASLADAAALTWLVEHAEDEAAIASDFYGYLLLHRVAYCRATDSLISAPMRCSAEPSGRISFSKGVVEPTWTFRRSSLDNWPHVEDLGVATRQTLPAILRAEAGFHVLYDDASVLSFHDTAGRGKVSPP